MSFRFFRRVGFRFRVVRLIMGFRFLGIVHT